MKSTSAALWLASPGWGMSSLGPRTRRAMLSHAALLVRPCSAAKKGPSFLSFPGRTYPTLATPERHFVRSDSNQRKRVAASTSTDLFDHANESVASASADFFDFTYDPRVGGSCFSYLPNEPVPSAEDAGVVCPFGSVEKEGPFRRSCYRDIQATRHATAWRGGCAVPERTHHPGSLREPLSVS